MSQPQTAAPYELMRRLHQAVLDEMLLYMTETPVEKRRASMMSVIRAFLRDNHVSVQTLQQDGYAASLQHLKDTAALPFPVAK